MDSTREAIADRLRGAAGTIREQVAAGAEALTDRAESAADKLDASASYIESRDARRMLQDLLGVIKRHATQSLLLAGLVGFLVARAAPGLRSGECGVHEGTDKIADRPRRYRATTNAQWRKHYEQNPWIFVAAAFAGGLLLSAAMPGRRRSRAREKERLESAVAAAADARARSQGSSTSDIWDRVKAVLLAAAGSQITSFLREIIPDLLGASRSTRQAGASDARSQNGSGISGGNGQATDKTVAQ
jgi:hypothetical protein